jgi:hypothetical protein
MPTYAYHFSAVTDPDDMATGLPPGYIAIVNGGEVTGVNESNARESDEEALKTLRAVIDALTEREIDVDWYVPASAVAVDHNGNIVWTNPSENPTRPFDPGNRVWVPPPPPPSYPLWGDPPEPGTFPRGPKL